MPELTVDVSPENSGDIKTAFWGEWHGPPAYYPYFYDPVIYGFPSGYTFAFEAFPLGFYEFDHWTFKGQPYYGNPFVRVWIDCVAEVKAFFVLNPAYVKGTVWKDDNHDSVWEEGEEGLSGAILSLYSSEGSLIDTTATGEGGLYTFTVTEPGIYYVNFELPEGFILAPEINDSEADPDSGNTDGKTLSDDNREIFFNAGAVSDSVISVESGAEFGNVIAGCFWEQPLKIKNLGTGSLEIGSIIDNTALPFSITSDACSGKNLEPGQSCFIEVEFSPVLTGNHVSDMKIPSNDPYTPVLTIDLSGTGVERVFEGFCGILQDIGEDGAITQQEILFALQELSENRPGGKSTLAEIIKMLKLTAGK